MLYATLSLTPEDDDLTWLEEKESMQIKSR